MSAHCNKCGYDLSLDLDCAHCAAVARAERAEADLDTAQASEARLREALDKADSALQLVEAQAGAVRETALAERKKIAKALASTPNPEERVCTCPPSAFTSYYTPANSCPRHGSAPDPTPEPEGGREWTLARLNGDGHLTKWDVIEDEELHRAVLSDPLWEVVTVREAAPTDPTTEEDR